MLKDKLKQFNPFRYFARRLCPYCFEHFSLRRAPFRCGDDLACTFENDKVHDAQWNENLALGKVLEPTGFWSTVKGLFLKTRRCGDCGTTSRVRLCPHCHMDLPYSFGEYENYIFAVIGAKDSGKSHYLAVLINEIRERIDLDFNALLAPADEKTSDRYRDDFEAFVYAKGEIIPTTRSGRSESAVRRPLVYTLTFSKKPLFGRKPRPYRTVTLVFFDTAGEDLVSEAIMETVNKYIYRSNGILLLVDPLQLDYVRNQLVDSTAMPIESRETSDILERTARLIEKGLGLTPNDPIQIPLALSFSKFDAVRPLMGDGQFQLLQRARHEGVFDQGDFEAVNGEMQDLLEEWDSRHLVHFAKRRFERCAFFGLSALGCNPHATQRIPKVLPQRVEDPFLWLLSQYNIIRRSKRA